MTPDPHTQPVAQARPVKDKGRKVIEKKNQQLSTLKVVYVAHDVLIPNPWNPNRQDEHTFELLCKSMAEDGFTQPIIVNDGSVDESLRNMICDGEHRWRASATVFGTQAEIPVVYVPFTPAQMRISTLRHNLARGEHDMELTGELLRELQTLGALDWAQDSLMLDDIELNRLLEDVKAPETLHSEEYGQAWVPDALGDKDVSEASTQLREVEATTHGGRMITAMSAAAVEATRDREKRIAQAVGEEEKKMAAAEVKLYRVSLIFQGDEAADIQAILGSEPAVKLLEICRRELAARQA